MTPSEREEIEKVAEEMVKYVFDCVQHGNSSMAHQFVEYSIITQVAKARNDQLKDDIKIVEGYSFMEAKDGYIGLDHEDSIAYQAGQEVKRGIVKALRNKLEKE